MGNIDLIKHFGLPFKTLKLDVPKDYSNEKLFKVLKKKNKNSYFVNINSYFEFKENIKEPSHIIQPGDSYEVAFYEHSFSHKECLKILKKAKVKLVGVHAIGLLILEKYQDIPLHRIIYVYDQCKSLSKSWYREKQKDGSTKKITYRIIPYLFKEYQLGGWYIKPANYDVSRNRRLSCIAVFEKCNLE